MIAQFADIYAPLSQNGLTRDEVIESFDTADITKYSNIISMA